MAIVEVSTGKLKEVAGKVEDLVSQYTKAIGNIYQIGQEIDNMWDGEASDKFINVLGTDQQRFSALTKLLTEYVEVLRKDAAMYEEAEKKVLDLLQNNKK